MVPVHRQPADEQVANLMIVERAEEVEIKHGYLPAYLPGLAVHGSFRVTVRLNTGMPSVESTWSATK